MSPWSWWLKSSTIETKAFDAGADCGGFLSFVLVRALGTGFLDDFFAVLGEVDAGAVDGAGAGARGGPCIYGKAAYPTGYPCGYDKRQ